MPLRKTRYRREPVTEINMTNLIDIVMVLLIVFILVSNFNQTALNIELPKVKYVESTGKERIIIGLNASGDISLNGNTIAKDELPEKLTVLKEQYPEDPVFVRSDRLSIVEDLMNVVSIAREVGFTSVNLPAIQSIE